MKLTPHKPTHIAAPNLPPGTVLGDPISTIFEAKISGDTIKGKFYGENVLGSGINFTGVRKTAVDAASPAEVTPMEVSLCELLSKPQLYNGKEVVVRAQYNHGFEWSVLHSPVCSSKEDLVWLDL